MIDQSISITIERGISDGTGWVPLDSRAVSLANAEGTHYQWRVMAVVLDGERFIPEAIHSQVRDREHQLDREVKRLADYLLEHYRDRVEEGSAVDVAIRILRDYRDADPGPKQEPPPPAWQPPPTHPPRTEHEQPAGNIGVHVDWFAQLLPAAMSIHLETEHGITIEEQSRMAAQPWVTHTHRHMYVNAGPQIFVESPR